MNGNVICNNCLKALINTSIRDVNWNSKEIGYILINRLNVLIIYGSNQRMEIILITVRLKKLQVLSVILQKEW